MLGYILIIAFGLIITFVVNAVLSITSVISYSVLYVGLSVLIYFIILFGMDALVALIIHKLPSKWFEPHKKAYRVFKWENKLYRKLGVMTWKDKVPDMGQLCNFKKNKVESLDNAYLHKFLVEMCYAEVIHIAMALSGIVILILCPINIMWHLALPMFFVNVFLQIPPIFIQRFNRPKLLKIYDIRNKRDLKQALNQNELTLNKNIQETSENI